VTVTERFWFLNLLIVLCWYSGLFVGLMFKRQQNESTYGKSVTVTERVLCFYCYWLCCFHIAVGLLVWCLKINRMNRFTVKVGELLIGFCVSTVIGCVVLIYRIVCWFEVYKTTEWIALRKSVILTERFCVSTVIGCVVLIMRLVCWFEVFKTTEWIALR